MSEEEGSVEEDLPIRAILVWQEPKLWSSPLLGLRSSFLTPYTVASGAFLILGAEQEARCLFWCWWLGASQPVSARYGLSFAPSRSVLTFINDQ